MMAKTKLKKAAEAALLADCKRRGLWPFPSGGMVKPMSARQRKRELIQELAALGECHFSTVVGQQ